MERPTCDAETWPRYLYSRDEVRAIACEMRAVLEEDRKRWGRKYSLERKLLTRARRLMRLDRNRVYFAQSGKGGPIKIGISIEVAKRISGLQTANPVRLILLGHVAGGALLEAALHKRFASERILGEWFRPTQPLLELISALTEAA